MSYYDDLSVGRSDNQESSNSESDNDDHEWLYEAKQGHSRNGTNVRFSTLSSGLWDRCILHLDVDCFYCQCEEIDRSLRNEPRPLAIGQKHIIVTANYEARKFGVQKLQSREAAYLACPHLWVVEGSDLIHYRRHSRAIYDAFRNALQEIADELGCSRIPAKKGCMDEMMADLTTPVETMISLQNKSILSLQNLSQCHPEQARFVFGEDALSSTAILVEDQTGQKSVVSFQQSATSKSPGFSLTLSRRNIHDTCGASDQDRARCQQRLDAASCLAERVSRRIRETTGFHTTCGISVSPLLAKLASGLNKPKSVNLLYPWRSSQLLYAMPLRKMHKIGYSTMKALEKELKSISDDGTLLHQRHNLDTSSTEKDQDRTRTVRDLLEMPRSSICQAIQGMMACQGKSSSEEQCEILIQQCRGLDTTEILDDDGGLPKTVSVENSFRRGTVKTTDSVHQALEELYQRLPLLLQDRVSWATDPQSAYPVTIRLTIRMVDPQLALTKRRRPYITKSKQTSIDGQRYLIHENDIQTHANVIRQHVKPLLQQLLPSTIDITRINIAVTNFQDIALAQQTASKMTSGQSTLAESLKRYPGMSPSQSQQSSLPSASNTLFNRCASETQTKRTRSHSLETPYRTTTKLRSMKSTKIDHFFTKK